MAFIILKRLITGIFTLFILISISFFVMRLAPGNPFVTENAASEQIMVLLNQRYHLNEPVYKQYLYYLHDIMRGDLGPSFRYTDYSVNELIKISFPVSFKLGVVIFIFAVVVGVSLGILASINVGGKLDKVLMTLTTVKLVLPAFILGPLLILFFAVYLKWLPSGGWNEGSFNYMILPVLSVGFQPAAVLARLHRSSLVQTLHAPFIKTYRAYGFSNLRILFSHALKPSLLPVLAYMGPTFVSVITGSIILENIFGIPGMGKHLVDGALNRDYSLVLGMTIIVGALTILINSIVDILLCVLDPRIRAN